MVSGLVKLLLSLGALQLQLPFGSAKEKVCSGLNSVGYTVPMGDVVLEYGEPLNLTCVLKEEEVKKKPDAVKYLEFRGPDIKRSMYRAVSNRSINLYIENHTKTEGTTYICAYNNHIVCMNVVAVGIPPQDVTDFKCLSLNYDNLKCTWTPPQNYVKTDYSLFYALKNIRPNRMLYSCPNIEYDADLNKKVCVWNISTTPQYRQAHESWTFYLYQNNTFGWNNQSMFFNHFKNVLPNPPENISAVVLSTHSINVSWIIPSSMRAFPDGVSFRVLYQCEHENKTWTTAAVQPISQMRNGAVYYILDNLKYAHEVYDIRVGLWAGNISSFTNADESLWSANATATNRTFSKIPGEPPKLTLGSFEYVSGNNLQQRDCYVYWRQIPELQNNGKNFTYFITTDSDIDLSQAEITKAYAKIKNLNIAKDYKLKIYSKNSEGLSVEGTEFYIPKLGDKLKEPSHFVKTAFGDGKYELSWNPPDLAPGQIITNYTIFWCNNDRDRPYQCSGNLNWTVIPANLTAWNQTVPSNSIYQFAIAVNSVNSSSGMLWAECTIIHNRSMGKMKSVWINKVGSTFIEVGWKLDCSDRIGIVDGYVIYYCPIKSPSQSDCKSPQKNVTIHNDNKGNITDLTPYTTYMLAISVITKNTYSQQSEPLYNTTNEAAPSVPINLRIINVTNTSISLSWEPPRIENGALKYYTVIYNGSEQKVDSHELSTTLENLVSFGKYNISIKACTVACSEESERIEVSTLISYPGLIHNNYVRSLNGSSIDITWDRPNPPQGPVDYYQVRLTTNENHTKIVNVTEQQFTIPNCGLETYLVSVRAVNIDEGRHLVGPWNREIEAGCAVKTEYTLIITLFVLVFFLIGLGFALKKLYRHCKEMQNVEVKMPPGLQTSEPIRPWGSEKNLTGGDRSTSPPDEELLLDKLSEGERVNLSGDSSGCSSGHESVTSSIETGSHISSSDSGTEQPRSPSRDELRKNSLRLRKGVGGYIVMPPTESNVNIWGNKSQPGSYCVVGNSSAAQESDGYVTAGALGEAKPPYVTCDLAGQPTVEPLKIQAGGYVPCTLLESGDKPNPSYVFAGSKNCLVPLDAQLEPKLEDLQLSKLEALKKGVDLPWVNPVESGLPSTGYVSVGDAPPPKSVQEHSKAYVPHRHFEAKSIKED